MQRSSSLMASWVPTLLDRWEDFLSSENTLDELPEIVPEDDTRFVRMVDAEKAVDDIIQMAIDQDRVVELSTAYHDAVAERDWTLPMLVRLNLRLAELILEWPALLKNAASGKLSVINLELVVIPAVGRREDLGRFVSPAASRALEEQGLVPENGNAVILGASTPDALLAWLSEPEKVMAWRLRCLQNQDQIPVAEGLPLIELEEGRPEEAHFGGFVYVVGMVARGTPDSLPAPSPIKMAEFEAVENAWAVLAQQWEGRLSQGLSITEPEDVWEGCVFAIGSTVLQSLYLQNAIGGEAYEDDEGPVFAIVVDQEEEAFSVVGLFPNGELVRLDLDEDMVAFLPALMGSPEFEFDLVDATALDEWVEQCRGDAMPVPAPKPRLLS